MVSIQDQIKSIKTRPDEKKYYTEQQVAEAVYSLLKKQDIDISILGRKAKSIYPKLLVFLLKLQHKGYCEYKPFPICQTSLAWRLIDRNVAKKLGLEYGNIFQSITFSYKNRYSVNQKWNMEDIYNIGYQQDLGRLLEMTKKLGILEEVKCGYSFISNSSMKNAKSHSKYYVMNKAKCEAVVSTLFHSLSITLSNPLTLTISTLSLHSIHSIQSYSFFSILPIVNTFVTAGTKYQQMMEKRNETLPDMEKCVFDGQRAWSQLCNLKKDSERIDYLTKRFGGEYEDWDRTACIPNLIYTLNTGKYNDNDIDLHEKLYGKKFESKEERENFKTLNMMKWFGDGRSIRGIIYGAHNAVDYNKTIKKSHKSILNALSEITEAYNHGSWKMFEEQSLNYYKEMKQKAEDYLGGTKKWRSNIFWHESNVHIMFVNELNKRGYDVAQIYDGFYFKKGCKPSDKELNDLYKRCVLEYRNTL